MAMIASFAGGVHDRGSFLIHSGKLQRSRGAQAPEFWLDGPRLKKARGDGAPSGASSPSVTRSFGPRGASRRAVSAISVPGAVASGRKRSPPGPPIRAASAALRLRRVQPLKAGPRSGAGRLARASRARGLRSHARGRRPEPHEPEQPVRVPSGDRARRNINLDGRARISSHGNVIIILAIAVHRLA